MYKKTIHDRLRMAFELNDDLKQADIARELGISRPSVSMWFSERPRRSLPNIETMSRLAKMLKVNLEWLVSGEGPMRLDTRRINTPPTEFSENFTTERKQLLTLIHGLDEHQRKTLLAFLHTVV